MPNISCDKYKFDNILQYQIVLLCPIGHNFPASRRNNLRRIKKILIFHNMNIDDVFSQSKVNNINKMYNEYILYYLHVCGFGF